MAHVSSLFCCFCSDPGVAGAIRPRPLKCCGIVGAGLMGGGIAMCAAEAGMKAVETTALNRVM